MGQPAMMFIFSRTLVCVTDACELAAADSRPQTENKVKVSQCLPSLEQEPLMGPQLRQTTTVWFQKQSQNAILLMHSQMHECTANSAST